MDVGLSPLLHLDAPDEGEEPHAPQPLAVGAPQPAPVLRPDVRPRHGQGHPEARPAFRACDLGEEAAQIGGRFSGERRDRGADAALAGLPAFPLQFFEVPPVGDRPVGVDLDGAGCLRARNGRDGF